MKTICVLHGCQTTSSCEQIERELLQVSGVTAVEVNLYKAIATIEHDADCDTQHFVVAIERAGCLGCVVSNKDSPDSKGLSHG